MKKILMALCAILTGCADYIPERPLPAARDLPEGSGITISISTDTVSEEYGYEFVTGETGGRIKCQVRVEIPDANMTDGVRTEGIPPRLGR